MPSRNAISRAVFNDSVLSGYCAASRTAFDRGKVLMNEALSMPTDSACSTRPSKIASPVRLSKLETITAIGLGGSGGGGGSLDVQRHAVPARSAVTMAAAAALANFD